MPTSSDASDRSALVVSLDFELYWGVRDRVSLDGYRDNLLGVRTVVPRLLELFSAYDVHATWATVGFLFCETKEELLDALPDVRPAYRDARLSPYDHIADIGRDEEHDPFHYAPSLIRQIASAPAQEVASHTFSHYYCLEPGQGLTTFEADLRAAVEVARRRGIRIESLVFPRNQVNPSYLPACRRLGIKAYRGTERSPIYASRADADERPSRRALRLLDAYAGRRPYCYRLEPGLEGYPVEIPSSRFLRPYEPRLAWLEPLRVRRVLRALDHAAAQGLVYHLWWHPHNFGVNTGRNLSALERILDRFAELRRRHGMRSLGMGELAARSERAAVGGQSDG